MSIFDIPLDVWHWYGDEAFSRKLRMVHPALAIPAQSCTDKQAPYRLGRYSSVCRQGRHILWYDDIVLGEGFTNYTDCPGAKCITSYDRYQSIVWTIPAAELSYYLTALGIDGYHGLPLDITFDGDTVTFIGGMPASPGILPNQQLHHIGGAIWSAQLPPRGIMFFIQISPC